VRVQINRRRMLQKFILAPRCLNDLRMAMTDADGHNSTEGIEISASVFVEYVLCFALHNHQRSFVVEEKPRIQKLATRAQYFFRGWPEVRLRPIIEWCEFRCLDHFVLETLSSPSANPLLEQLAPSFRHPHQCPPVTVYPSARKSSASSDSIWTAASNGIGFKCS